MKRRSVFVTANFERNLDALESFRTESPSTFEKVLRRLGGEVLTLLRRQPGVGRLYDQGRHPRALIDRVRDRLGGGVLREVIVGEYLVLYLVSEQQVSLLSIRHQREVDFDFGD